MTPERAGETLSPMPSTRPPDPELVPALEGAGAPGGAEGRAGRFRRILGADEWLLLAMRRLHGPSRTRVARALTTAGDGRSWTVVGCALLASCNPTAMRLGLRLAAGAGIATLATQALKRSLTRARPTKAIEGFQALADDPDAFSFPSGHTAAAFAVAAAFAGEAYGAGPASLLLAIGIGLSRVYLGAHYPLDVVAGATIGTLAGLVARLAVP